jgi:hypothetical protein
VVGTEIKKSQTKMDTKEIGKKGENTECPTSYRTRHFFNNSNINEDIAKKFEKEYVRYVRNVTS